MSFHTLIFIGHLGRDPEMRNTPTGQAVANFSVATNRQYIDGQGQVVKETLWFRISAFGKTAETCAAYLKKGSKVLVEGHLQADPTTGGPRIWQGQRGPGASFEVKASTVRFLSGRGDGGDEQGDDNGAVAEAAAAESDIPF